MFALHEDAFIFNEFLEAASNDSESEDLWTEDAAEAIDSASKCDLEQILMNYSDWSKSKNGTNVDELTERCAVSRRILISSKFERLSDVPLRLHQKVFYIILDPRQAVVGTGYLCCPLSVAIEHILRQSKDPCEDKTTAEIETYCQMMRDNLDYLYDNDKLQMSHNLKVVRIEDFLVNSRQLAFEMIDFAHFGPSGHLNDWLNTHLNEETEKTFLSWRTSLSYNQVAVIEHTCKDVLKEIGYSLANNIHVFEDAKIRLVFLSFS